MSTSSTVDPSCADLSLFRRQYLQLVEPRHILLPPAEVLAESSFQESLYNSVFAPDAIEHAPPPRYTFTVLKRLIPALEKATSTNPDHEASEDLYNLYTEYLCAPPPPTSPTARVAVTYTLPPPHLPITLQESPNLISGALTTGHRTWEAALALCEYLLVHKELLQSCQYLLELGAGTGMVALVAARLGVARIMATDGDEAVVDTLAHNVKLNQLEEAVTCKKLWWGAEGNSSEFTAPPDVVLGADVTYEPLAIPSLVQELVRLFAQNPAVKVVVSATIRNEETFETFRTSCKENGLLLEEEVWRAPGDGTGSGGKEGEPGERWLFYNVYTPIRIVTVTKALEL